MHTFKVLMMASAVVVTGVAFSGSAHANFFGKKDTHVVTTTDTHHGMSGHTVTDKRVVTTETRAVVGARKVGHVGGRPYPITGGYVPENSGGVYYAEDTNTYYANPAFDVTVLPVGEFNK